jgi:hypothetical protein
MFVPLSPDKFTNVLAKEIRMHYGQRLARGRMGRYYALIACVLASAVLPSEAVAQWGGEFRGQMGFGGDKLATVTYSDGSESTLTLGKHFAFSAGPIFEAWSSDRSMIELQAMFGWSGWSTGPKNTDDRLKISRYPAELLAYYGHHLPGQNLMLRFGGGATYALGGRIRGTGSLKNQGYDADFKNTLGYTGEVSIVSGPFTTGIRYTKMDAVFKGGALSQNASYFGLFMGVTSERKKVDNAVPLTASRR